MFLECRCFKATNIWVTRNLVIRSDNRPISLDRIISNISPNMDIKRHVTLVIGNGYLYLSFIWNLNVCLLYKASKTYVKRTFCLFSFVMNRKNHHRNEWSFFTFHFFHDDKYSFWSFKHSFEIHHTWMMKILQNRHLILKSGFLFCRETHLVNNLNEK